MPPDVKPGYQTTEWWLTLVGQVMPMLVLFHVVNQADVDSLQGAAVNIVQAVFAIVASAGLIWKYIQSRRDVKVAAIVKAKEQP